MRAAAVALLLVAALAGAHTPGADEVVASLASPAARTASGVDRAERDGRNPRVLLVHVGPAWFALPRDARAAAAADWRRTWRHAVPQGIVAVLDGRERAVVQYGRAGEVVALRDGS